MGGEYSTTDQRHLRKMNQLSFYNLAGGLSIGFFMNAEFTTSAAAFLDYL